MKYQDERNRIKNNIDEIKNINKSIHFMLNLKSVRPELVEGYELKNVLLGIYE